MLTLRRLFCKHKYEYYHKDRTYPLFSSYGVDRWHYICKQCGKTTSLTDEDVSYDNKRISIKVAKEEALYGVDNEYKDSWFSIGSICWQGKSAHYMKKVYHNFSSLKESKHEFHAN